MRLFTLLFLVLIGSGLNAQQDPLVTTHWNNHSLFNPATSGLEYKHQAAITYRNQWVGITGAPVSLFANYNTLLGKNHGVGVNYTYETIGFTKAQFLHLNYNYQFQIDEDRKLALGISPGLSYMKFEGLWVTPTGVPDPSLPTSTTNIDFNGGVAYNGKSIYAGIGVTHFAELLKYKAGSGSFHQVPHAYAHFRNELMILGRFKLYLEGIYRTDFIKYSFDLNARAIFFQKLMLGTGYRFEESFMFFGSWDFKEKFRLGYAYDLPHPDFDLNEISKGSHEITLGFNIPHRPVFKSIGFPDF